MDATHAAYLETHRYAILDAVHNVGIEAALADEVWYAGLDPEAAQEVVLGWLDDEVETLEDDEWERGERAEWLLEKAL